MDEDGFDFNQLALEIAAGAANREAERLRVNGEPTMLCQAVLDVGTELQAMADQLDEPPVDLGAISA